MKRQDLTDVMNLPCGCVMGKHCEAFVMIPCDPSCQYYRYALEESRRQRKPVAFELESTDH